MFNKVLDKKYRSVMFKSVVLSAVIVFFVFIGSRMSVNAGQFEVVSVDMNQVMEAHPALHQAIEEFQSRVEKLQEGLGDMDDDSRMMAQQMIQGQMQQIGMELQEKAFNEVRADIRKVANAKGYKYVLDKDVLIVGGKDITQEVLDSIAVSLPEEVGEIKSEELPMIPVE